MILHNTPHRGQPPLSNREHEKPDAGSRHRSRRVRRPADKPEVVADGEVEIHEHVPHVHGHTLVHAHDHSIIVGESTRDQRGEEGLSSEEMHDHGVRDKCMQTDTNI